MFAFTALLLALAPAHAELPLPTYPECGEEDRPDLCPSDLNEKWWMISYIPADSRDTVRPAELDLGSGLHADKAFRKETGRFDVLVAIADSGINWSNSGLVNKFYINPGEVPLPEGPDGTPSATYDYNGDGLVNVQDWADDPRVDWDSGDDVADGMLDPSDLIATFSDGVDDDDNGYPDDISGWDFFGHDNDAWHTLDSGYGTHGDGVAEEAAAEGGDSTSDIGVCPNCAILPIRTGDTFLTDGARIAEAISFAADSGAVVVSLASGALNNPEAARDAVRYAFEMGTSVVGASGDENAYHHNFAAALPNVLYVHSIHANAEPAYSYMNTWNCNNYGARLDFVAPSNACASGAVAIVTGLVGLIQSAARDAGTTLTPGEVYQVIRSTVDDVWLTDQERERSKAYPSEEGWDPFYGYGRVNAEKAVDAVMAGDIPPWVDIHSPDWFEVVSPADTSSVEVTGTVSAERSDSFTWKVELGTGHNPRTWTEVGAGSGTDSFTGTLATIDLATLAEQAAQPVPEALEGEGILERLERVNGPAVTVRVTVTDAEGREGVMRRTFFAHTDDSVLPGFPYALGGDGKRVSGESSPILADLDGDGVDEIIVGNADGRVVALDGSGQEMPGWPVRTDPSPYAHPDAPAFANGDVEAIHDPVMATVAVGDLDGDGAPEVVAAGGLGGLYAWHADGTPVSGFPVHTIGREPDEFDAQHAYDQGYAGAPALYDLDGDGTLEIIAAAMDSRLYVYDHTGADWGPYPIEICAPELCGVSGNRIINSPTVGDVDGDGDPDIGFGTNEAVNDGRNSIAYLIDAATGEALPGWPLEQTGLANTTVLLPLVGEGHPASLAFADLDGDGRLEVASPVMLGSTGITRYDGSEYLSLSYLVGDFGADNNVSEVASIIQLSSEPAFGDLDGDGVPDYVLGGVSSLYLVTLALSEWKDYQQPVAAWSGADGAMLPGWPRQIEDAQFLTAPAVADVDGDGKPEVIYGSGGYLLHAWNAAGQEAPGWPKFTGNWQMGAPAVGDVDGDGYLDVVATTREGWLWAWSTEGPADQDVQWASIHHDPQNTGNYETPLPRQAGPAEDTGAAGGEKGCCKKGGSNADAAWMLLPIGLGAIFRRRAERSRRLRIQPCGAGGPHDD